MEQRVKKELGITLKDKERKQKKRDRDKGLNDQLLIDRESRDSKEESKRQARPKS